MSEAVNEPEKSKLPSIPEDIAEASKVAGREYTIIGLELAGSAKKN